VLNEKMSRTFFTLEQLEEEAEERKEKQEEHEKDLNKAKKKAP